MTDKSITRLWTFADGTTAPDAPQPVTDEQINSLERKFLIKLPATMIELYRRQNGGFSEHHMESLWSIERGNNCDMTSLQVLATTYHEDPGLEAEWRLSLGDLSRVIVMLGDGHYYFALNYNDLHEGEPRVWYVADSIVRSTAMLFGDWLFSDGGVA